MTVKLVAPSRPAGSMPAAPEGACRRAPCTGALRASWRQTPGACHTGVIVKGCCTHQLKAVRTAPTQTRRRGDLPVVLGAASLRQCGCALASGSVSPKAPEISIRVCPMKLCERPPCCVARVCRVQEARLLGRGRGAMACDALSIRFSVPLYQGDTVSVENETCVAISTDAPEL